MIEVTELPESELNKSYTYMFYKDKHGRCTKCFEMTSLLDSCCGAQVDFEGYSFSMDELWEQIEEDLKQVAKNQAYDQKETEEK